MHKLIVGEFQFQVGASDFGDILDAVRGQVRQLLAPPGGKPRFTNSPAVLLAAGMIPEWRVAFVGDRGKVDHGLCVNSISMGAVSVTGPAPERLLWLPGWPGAETAMRGVPRLQGADRTA